MYNYKLIWPLLQLVANHLDVAFEPGEAILGSSSDQMYNADDLIKVGTDNALVLETSGLYELHDKPRFGYNQIKGIFRALTMLRSVVKKYHFATINTLKQLKVFFIRQRYEGASLVIGNARR
ncbi:hypothetical protein BCV72DRAFT_102024 [Rhizopus microsporus var. microsporus]|uniref:Uncharacterized protein n=1 Tax=Rhizopus microsporus var. microsporus TaxID=86635 RepID=A0A1X0R6S2_RHIZD|nr:hypothetical protein BCV72DRAFT_102024 [Rhizopus microsporus var. microsporus]